MLFRSPRLKGRHVIVRTDSTVTAAYINRQGDLGSPTLQASLAMGSSTVQFTQVCSCARAPKRGGGHVVQRGTKSRRVDTPPPGGRGNLVPIWQGGGRPVCDQRIFSLPTFLLPEERRSSSGMGCAGAPLAADPALCLPPIHPPPSPSAQGANGTGEANPGCTVLASHVLVLDDSYPTGGSAMDASSQGGPPVSGRREIVPLLPSRAKAGSLAPERDRLLALGIPEAVVRTI